MKSYSFESRDVPVLMRTEVLVDGSGPAGTSAAVASARTGAKRLIV
jgi:thioredoxin reductase